MTEPRMSDQDLSDLRHSNRHDSPVCAFIGRDATAKSINMNQVCDDLIDCRARCAALDAEVSRTRIALDESVALQSHQAKMLNIYDGGERREFATGDEWIARLVECGRIAEFEARK